MKTATAIRGLLLDIDGTLVDSNDDHAHAWVKAFAESGKPIPFEVVRPMIGMGGDKLLPKAAGIDAESSEGKKINKRRGEIFRTEYLPSLRPTPGARELLLLLKSRGFRMVAATSAKKEELEPLLKVCGADGVIESTTTSDDVEKSKPDPDILVTAVKKLGLPTHEIVMLGDTPYDVESAKKTGVKILVFRCGGWKDDDLAEADAIYDDPQDLMDRLDESLLF